jgi:hypothetical protein
MNELAKLGSSQVMVPPGITKALAKASKAAESSQEAMPPIVSTSESPEVMEINSNWHTPFMIYLMIEGFLQDKDECEQLCH